MKIPIFKGYFLGVFERMICIFLQQKVRFCLISVGFLLFYRCKLKITRKNEQ